ncbi:killer cell lectin-like receptor subfamily F member 2 isoform X2 [Pelodiscus sinensis]|uniref:killer cell lectin-like receptor subfamily F member 2 isoform X2 n=1 Tax=Pelodiscus sinensis TaxID=13735 RepID=UPI000704737B|nr:killer cell lectin-like receptor subfamily F member 2 [Pelodiscus sinensis]|eukprot:XP_014434377.1 killer cell lectin-like receptor subfamily F member 2 [Pelodiscus sinensis]
MFLFLYSSPCERFQTQHSYSQLSSVWFALDSNKIDFAKVTRSPVVSCRLTVFQGCPSKAEERPAWTSNGVIPITSNGRAYNSSLEDLVSRLKQSVCDPAQINSAGGARCKLCPVNWRLHEDKCYWLSKELNSWSESREDCTRKGSEMLVIQNTEQMDHLQSALPEADHIWIGLAFNSSQGKWTWLDGASVPELGPRMGKVNTNSCGVLQRRNIEFENCSVKLKWPCLKAAFPL